MATKKSSKASKSTKAKSEKKARTKGVPTSKIMLTFLIQGLDAVAALGASKVALRKAIPGLEAQGVDAKKLDAFRAFVVDTVGEVGEGRGRSAPEVGQTRTYKAQALKDGSAFIRLPVESLGIGKGGSVEVVFVEGETQVRPVVAAKRSKAA